MRRTGVTFSEAHERLGEALRGSARGEILDALTSGDGADAPHAPHARLRRAMHAHTFPTAAGPLILRRIVDALDTRTRREGLHVLQGWDYVAHRFPDEIAPILLLDYCARAGAAIDSRRALAILLDQYFLAVLSLLVVRAWDDGDANENLDHVGGLLRDLGGAHGSGRRFVDEAETLLLLAVSYFHPEERGYDSILERVKTLDAAHQLRCALPCAAIQASHLRWGLRFMYRRDVARMRADNAVDYRWLLYSLLTLMREYSRMHAEGAHDARRECIVEALLNGLSADPWAFVGNAPSFLRALQPEHDEFRALLAGVRADLLQEFEAQRPGPAAYSPLAFSANFLSNAAVAMVVVALRDEEAHPSLDSLMTRERAGASAGGSAQRLAQKLMDYSVENAARLGDGGAPLVVVDQYDATHCCNAVVQVIQQYDN